MLAGQRIVIANWRDREHPLGGGAEEYATRMADAMSAAGAQVTFLTARGEGQRSRAKNNSMVTVRRGGRLTVYFWALLWLFVNRRRIDAVIDCHNGIPFFSPLVTTRRTRVVLVLHHVHDAQFAVHFPPWLARIGRFLEGPVSRRVYRRAATVTVSESTVRAMRERLAWRGPITVVPNGMVHPELTGTVSRAAQPTLVCLGRLVVHKRVDRLIAMVGKLREYWPDLRLHVIGSGPEEQKLRILAGLLGDTVTMHGYVDDDTKSALLRSSWLNVMLSDGEGWGLAVIEAAAHGVPTVGREVEGLCDSIRHDETGWLVPAGEDVAGRIDKSLHLLADPAGAAEIAAACQAWAARFDWDTSGRQFVELVARLLDESVESVLQEDLCDAW